ncbi:hypothetical protein R1flu_029011 [Riccia fluitans]|uniref:Uncharacterized protein n=1 Tax=Riccia fluitans TaxID=41844 RepID=A0ABD1XSD9_9MARC
MADYGSFFDDDDCPPWLTASKEALDDDQNCGPIFALGGSNKQRLSWIVREEELQAPCQWRSCRNGTRSG